MGYAFVYGNEVWPLAGLACSYTLGGTLAPILLARLKANQFLANGNDKRTHLPELWTSIDGGDADRCLYLLPRVRRLRCDAPTETRRLLRVLFLRLGTLSADAGERIVLSKRIGVSSGVVRNVGAA